MPEQIINYILVCVICALIGSVPFASIIVKLRHNKDITQHGTGNVGAMNSFDITGSKTTGIYVFLLDFLKGVIPTCIIYFILDLSFILSVLPIVLLVTGHCFSIFLKFKGGRGLATAAGIFLIVSFPILILWGIFYYLIKKVKDNVHIASVVATFLLPFPVMLFPDFFGNTSLLKLNNVYNPTDKEFLFILTSSVCLVILLKHIQPISELIKNYNINKNI